MKLGFKMLISRRLAMGLRGINRMPNSGLMRMFSANKQSEEDEFRKIFEGKNTDMTFKTYEVYFLRKDMELMNRHIKSATQIAIGIGGLAAATYLFTGSAVLGIGLTIAASLPLTRASLFRIRTKQLVSSIWVSPNMKTIEIIYGTQLSVAKGPIENLEPLRTQSMSQGKGFHVYFNFKDDSGKVHPELQVMIEPKICEVDNVVLLSRLLTGNPEELEKFQYTGDPRYRTGRPQ